MSGMGSAVMGTGEASGENRASVAAEEAIANPLLDDVSLKGARGLLLSITGGRDLTLYEVDEAASRVRQEVDPEANIIVGATFDETLGERVRVSIVASGMMRQGEPAPMPAHGDPRQRHQARAPQPQPPPPPQARPEMQRNFAPTPPPQQGEDMQRRLSEAIGGDADTHERQAQQREVWRAPGNVVIEEGFAQMSWAARPQAQAAPTGETASQPTGHFIPAPPADLRRAGRRMPEVDDFPPVAQREYRAKTGYSQQAAPSSTQTLPHEGGQRRGILQRIISRARGDDMDDPPTSNAAPDPRRISNSTSDDWWTGERDSQGPEEEDDRGPLPEFFNRQRT
jgi:cell division protein FtsZ